MIMQTRAMMLTSLVVVTSTAAGFFINVFLAAAEAIHGLPRVTLYAPLASIMTNVVAMSAVSDARAQTVFAASREFMAMQLIISLLLIFAASTLALARHKIVSASILASLFVIPGVVSMKTLGVAYLSGRLPGVIWAPPSLREAGLQIALSVPLYALLFAAGIVIVTDNGKPGSSSRAASDSGQAF